MTNIISEVRKWNELTIIDNHLCRICMSLTDLLIPIFQEEGIDQGLPAKIKKYLPIKISPSDTLPHQICYVCAGTLMAWNTLYNDCIKTDQKFQSILQKKKSIDTVTQENNSDDEPLMPPKKRKVIEGKREISGKNMSTLERSEKKNCISTRIKKLNKSEEKVPNKKDKNESKKNSENIVDTIASNASMKEDLLTIIKIECDSEEEPVNNIEAKSDNETLDNCLIKCGVCNKYYKDKKYLTKHIKKFHDKAKSIEAQKCDLCGHSYKTRNYLEKHFLQEHLTNQVPCPVCHLPFNSKKLDLHLKNVHGIKTGTNSEEKFKCKKCDKWFNNKYARNSHVREVHLNEPKKCKLCDFEGVRAVLRRHRSDVHAEKRFMCSLCPSAFKTLHTLKMHMTSHSDIRCYTCDICGMGFKRLNNVRDHMKCHEQKSNQCQICGNFFARKRYLAIHEKTIHNFYADGVIPEEKGFECGICGAKLKWKKNLLAHMRIHTGEKPYNCKICNQDFICHGSLRTHMAKHSVCVLNEEDPRNHLSVEVNVFKNFSTDQI